MKDLIAVFTYCPDTQRKLILNELLESLQPIRKNFDIIVLSHSEIPSTTKDLADFSFVESDNRLLYDFDLRNKFWFKAEKLFLHSSLVYQFSTHFSIYSLIHYVINFSKFKGYKKIHCVEYDLKVSDISIFNNVSDRLNNFDNVVFRSEDGWIHGTYVAFTTTNFPNEYFQFSEKFILDEIRKVETKMTEHYTPMFLSVNGRTTHYESSTSISKEGSLQKNDSHGNNELNWCVPIIEKDTDRLFFFLYNEKGGQYDLDVIYNDKHINLQTSEIGIWKLIPLGNFSEINKLLVLVNNKIKHTLNFDENNRTKFAKHNYMYWR